LHVDNCRSNSSLALLINSVRAVTTGRPICQISFPQSAGLYPRPFVLRSISFPSAGSRRQLDKGKVWIMYT